MPRKDNFSLSQPVFGEPVFNEAGNPTPDPTVFTTPHPSDAKLYNQIQNLLTKDVVSFDQMRGQPGDLYTLTSALGDRGPQAVQTIQAQQQISFHVVGDSGASAQGKYQNEISVSDALTNDFHLADPANRPAFLFHLGDLVYDFGESQYYYDQFYDPFRNYAAPIFAIPGNHDSFVVPNTPPANTPLSTFVSNFCALNSVVTQEAGSLHRTAMTQPGVYFTLDAPFVRIIGLFSNALEDPGVISSENGKWPIPDFQLDYLNAQLQRVLDENYTGALLLAMHHPPFAYSPPAAGAGGGGTHSSSSPMLQQIDAICTGKGVYPHAVLSGHSHNYQRYTRTIAFSGKQIAVPFVVCGNGGHNVNPLVSARGGQPGQEPNFGADVSYLDSSSGSTPSLTLNEFDDALYGYLTVTASASKLTIMYNRVGQGDDGRVYAPVFIDVAGRPAKVG